MKLLPGEWRKSALVGILWEVKHWFSLWFGAIKHKAITWVNTLRPRQNGHHFADDILKRIFFNENVWISIKISLKFVPTGRINNIPALVQILAWRRSGDKPLSEPMMVSLLTHICVTRPQWVNVDQCLWHHMVSIARIELNTHMSSPEAWVK